MSFILTPNGRKPIFEMKEPKLDPAAQREKERDAKAAKMREAHKQLVKKKTGCEHTAEAHAATAAFLYHNSGGGTSNWNNAKYNDRREQLEKSHEAWSKSLGVHPNPYKDLYK